mmetsp:Transcript_50038/g.160130  ORF Transcript_50038/g.160130 Transcript_50038/m.160130 type:complete len:124 (+) Transcript_50038:614-985(+)
MKCISSPQDLVSTWNKFLLGSTILVVLDLLHLVAYVAVWLPWPYKKREVVIKATGMNVLEDHGCMLLSFCSCDNPHPRDRDFPKNLGETVRCEVLRGSGILLTPLPPSRPGGRARTCGLGFRV